MPAADAAGMVYLSRGMRLFPPWNHWNKLTPIRQQLLIPKYVKTAMAASAKCSPYEIICSEEKEISNMLNVKATILQSRLTRRLLAIILTSILMPQKRHSHHRRHCPLTLLAFLLPPKAPSLFLLLLAGLLSAQETAPIKPPATAMPIIPGGPPEKPVNAPMIMPILT